MRICRSFLATVCLMIACADPVFSEDLTPDKKADIQKLLEMTGASAIGQQMVDQTMVRMTQALKARRPGIPQKVLDALREEVNGVVRDNMSTFLDLAFPIYHKYLSHEEIKGMIQFYSTDLGQKVIRILPSLMQDSMRAGQLWGQSLEPEINRRIRDRLKSEGVDLAGAGPERPSQPTALVSSRYTSAAAEF